MSTYTLILIPLDSREAATSPSEFSLKIVLTPTFPAGLLPSDAIAALLNDYPLLVGGLPANLTAHAVEYSQWINSGKTIVPGAAGVTGLKLQYSGASMS